MTTAPSAHRKGADRYFKAKERIAFTIVGINTIARLYKIIKDRYYPTHADLHGSIPVQINSL